MIPALLLNRKDRNAGTKEFFALMKVALVLECLDWRKGGLESWTWQFTQLLKAKGIEVHVVAFGFHPSVAELGIVAHKLESMPRSRIKRAEALEQYLRTQDFDVTHDMGVGWHADIFHSARRLAACHMAA